MSPPLGLVEEVPDVKVNAPVSSLETTAENFPVLTEHNYMGLSDSSPEDSSVVNSGLYEKDNFNIKATELRLGLPGSESPVRDLDFTLSNNIILVEKNLLPVSPIKEAFSQEKHLRTSVCPALQKNIACGNKRIFSDAIDGISEGKYIISSGLTTTTLGMLQGAGTWCGEHSGTCAPIVKERSSSKISQDRARISNELDTNNISSAGNPGIAPAAKAQVVGWPPIRSYRKNTLAATSKGNEEVDGKPCAPPMFVKVGMDGAPYLRKVDLKTCGTYNELSSALEKMFSGFTIGHCVSHGVPEKAVLSESKLIDLIHGSEYVLTYEDKDGDWMLVGDVPWDVFVDSCRRLRIMKGSDAIGLAPRAVEKCSSRS